MSDLRYPIGPYEEPRQFTEALRREWIEQVARAPQAMRAAVRGLTPSQLDTPYRPGGWSVRQVVHHVPDSHMNAYTRFKLALTEEAPTIRPYFEDRWARLSDTATVPVEVSLSLLEALHQRWVPLLSAMTPAEYARSFHHPEAGRSMTLEYALGQYAWHGRHHVAHIVELRRREGW